MVVKTADIVCYLGCTPPLSVVNNRKETKALYILLMLNKQIIPELNVNGRFIENVYHTR
jgi:hypothetical protein